MPIDYYNDNDPGAVAWLEALCAAGEIPDGKVDSRSILDVRADELSGFRRVHFFAGIGGWAEALGLADWPHDLTTWTGSPPCQPFSVAGKGLSRDDPRHLAPHFAGLVGAGCPLVLFGEQVAGAEVLGPVSGPPRREAAGAPAWAWSDDLQDRLEAAGYAYGAADLCSAGVGAPHIRQRLFFGAVRRDALPWIALRLADHYGHRWVKAGGGLAAAGHDGAVRDGAAGRVGDGLGIGLESGGGDHTEHDRGLASATGAAGRVGDGQRARLEGLAGHGARGGEPGRQRAIEDRPAAEAGAAGIGHNRPGPLHGFWADADWLLCRDERWRPVEPGTFPLADGIPERVGLLRGYGNAINPHLAAAFIEAFARTIIDIGRGA